ncbi:MAG TPA: OmpA family protein [Ignavibacteriaceae bacterium]|jgi:outer membrane protein OmpA-like peptidoglycan-associated protein
MNKFKNVFFVLAISASIILAGCGASNTVKGGAIGTVGGGVVGGVIGKQLGNTTLGAVLGAVIGGTAGALIGNHMDKQAEELEKELENAKVERVGEGIAITFDSGILFGYDSATLQPEAKTNIKRLADILKKYPGSNILVTGHTDSDGTEKYNQTLSEKRAKSVADYAILQGVSPSSISTIGLGETEPIASNDTVEGKKLNRRVEIAIYASDELKKAAEEGTLK